jgi:hypothetical protein
MTVAINEDTYAERPALEWLEEVGWPVVEGKEIAPNSPGAERSNYQDVILADRLRGTVKELNPQLPTIVIEQVVTCGSLNRVAASDSRPSGVPSAADHRRAGDIPRRGWERALCSREADQLG